MKRFLLMPLIILIMPFLTIISIIIDLKRGHRGAIGYNISDGWGMIKDTFVYILKGEDDATCL